MRNLGVALILALTIFACGNSESATLGPTTVDGEELFELKAIGSKPGCVTCHSLTPDRVLVGPSLANLSERAGDVYVRRSIIDPSAHEGDRRYSTQMPDGYAEVLSDEQLDSLIGYLMEVS